MRSFGSQRERHRDHHPLPHAAAELVRIALELSFGVGDPDEPEQLGRAGPGAGGVDLAVGLDGLLDLFPDPKDRVQARHRVLEDHRDVASAQRPHLLLREVRDVPPVELDLAADLGRGFRRQQAHEGEAGHALAGARLADESEGLASIEMKADAVHGEDRPVQHPEADPEVPDVEQRGLRTRGQVVRALRGRAHPGGFGRGRKVPPYIGRSISGPSRSS